MFRRAVAGDRNPRPARPDDRQAARQAPTEETIMEMSWMETFQLLGLDVVAFILMALVAARRRRAGGTFGLGDGSCAQARVTQGGRSAARASAASSTSDPESTPACPCAAGRATATSAPSRRSTRAMSWQAVSPAASSLPRRPGPSCARTRNCSGFPCCPSGAAADRRQPRCARGGAGRLRCRGRRG